MALLRGSLGLLLLSAAACGDDGRGEAGTASIGTSVTTLASTSAGGDSSGSGSGSGGVTDATTGPDGSGTSATTTTATTTTTTTTTTFGTTGSTGWWETSSGTSGEMCKLNIDIVFVMDVSTSMAAILQKLEDEILVVDAAITALDLSTEVHYGLVVFVDDAKIILDGAPYVDVQQLKSDFNYWRTFTQSNSQVSGMGSNFDWPENTLDALYLAAGAFQWRPLEQTLRMVIHTTDDTFGEKGAVQSGVTIQHGYDETVLALQEREIRVFSFADNDMTGGPGDNQDVSMGFFTPYQGKTPIPAATDGGAFNLGDVYGGSLSLSAAIGGSITESLCTMYIPQ